jgi:hypothetical protein
MSITLMGKIFKLENVLTSSEKFVLLSLADHGNDDGLSIYPSISLTSKRTSLDERSVRRIQNNLSTKGFLLKTPGGGGRLTNNYQVNVPFIDQILSGQAPLSLTICPPCPDVESSLPLTICQGSEKDKKTTPDSMPSLPGLYALPPLTVCPPTPDVESSESLINHKRIVMINHEEEEEESAPKLSSSASSEIDWEIDLPIPGSPLGAENHPIIKLFILATGRIPGIKDYPLVIDTLRMLRKRFQSDQTLVDYLEPFWISWQGRKAKSGHNYRLSSLVWLTEWAVNNDIPGSKRSDPPRRSIEADDEFVDDLQPQSTEDALYCRLRDKISNDFKNPENIYLQMSFCSDDLEIIENQVAIHIRDEGKLEILNSHFKYIEDSIKEISKNNSFSLKVIPPSPEKKLLEDILLLLENEKASNSIIDPVSECEVEISENEIMLFTVDQYSADLLNSRLKSTLQRYLMGAYARPMNIVIQPIVNKLALGVNQ